VDPEGPEEHDREPKPVVWMGSSKDDLSAFPSEAQHEIGYALYLAQLGEKHPHAKPLKGFGGGGILEIVEDFDRNSYRAVYTVKFEEAVYTLHVFQKKSRAGIKTPKGDLDLVKARLKRAQEIHQRSKP
jgi:phage-related protein